jgi:hypothetical protein
MKVLADSHWMDAVPAGQHTGLLSDFTRFMKRFSVGFAAFDLHYVDPWERKRRQPLELLTASPARAGSSTSVRHWPRARRGRAPNAIHLNV